MKKVIQNTTYRTKWKLLLSISAMLCTTCTMAFGSVAVLKNKSDSIPPAIRTTVQMNPVGGCLPIIYNNHVLEAYNFNIYETSETFVYAIKYKFSDSLLPIPSLATPPYISQVKKEITILLNVADKSIVPEIQVKTADSSTCIAGYINAEGNFIECYKLQLVQINNLRKCVVIKLE